MIFKTYLLVSRCLIGCSTVLCLVFTPSRGILLCLLIGGSLVCCLLVMGILCLVLVHASGSLLLSSVLFCLLIGGSLVCCSHLLSCILRLALVHHPSGRSILLCLSIGGSLLLLS
jgi:hypothetical protein